MVQDSSLSSDLEMAQDAGKTELDGKCKSRKDRNGYGSPTSSAPWGFVEQASGPYIPDSAAKLGGFRRRKPKTRGR